MKQPITLTLAQLNFPVCDIEGNAERILQACQTAVDDQMSDLIIFPEMALTGYTPEDLFLREETHQRCQAALTHIQTNMPDITVVLGMPWKEDAACYNAAIVLQQHTITAKYYKQQLPNYQVFDEKRYFQAGDHSTTFNVNGHCFGLLICEDCWHDAPAQQAINAGAQGLIIINASPFDQNKQQQRQQILSQLAIMHTTPIVYTNLIGGQDEMVFDGGSMLVNGSGQTTHEAPHFEESLFACQFPPSEAALATPTTYDPLTSIYNALVLGVRDYVNKNHFKGVLIGLSGGIDSALTLAIAVDALGADRVTTVMMPSIYTSDMSVTDATQMANCLNVTHKTMSIDAIKNCALQELQDHLQPQQPNTTEENIQARIRGLLLMALSNNSGHLVLTTGNRSEMAVGYATLYGDMAGGFAVLKDIPKTMVYDLAKHYNEHHPTMPIPHNIITRAPSAELAPNQQDQDTLPPYDILDPILHYVINCQYAASRIEQLGFDRSIIDRIIALVKRNEYKRRQAPIGIRISHYAFGKDRRYPITAN